MNDRPRWWEQPLTLATFTVGAITLLLILSITLLYATGKTPPAGLTTVVGSGVGALATLLVSHREKGDDQ